jgi:L-iditol 2-dehydrogenase
MMKTLVKYACGEGNVDITDGERLQSSLRCGAAAWERMMKIYAEGRVRLNDLISAKLPISDWRTAFSLCENKKAVKVLMYPE